MNEDAVLAVKKGIYWLDENYPGWAFRVDVNELDMSECKNCVIGQAVGEYSDITDGEIGGGLYSGVIWAVEHGFEQPSVIMYQMNAAAPIPATYDYSVLDELWAREVEERNT